MFDECQLWVRGRETFMDILMAAKSRHEILPAVQIAARLTGGLD
jgi:hypothetical protein